MCYCCSASLHCLKNNTCAIYFYYVRVLFVSCIYNYINNLCFYNVCLLQFKLLTFATFVTLLLNLCFGGFVTDFLLFLCLFPDVERDEIVEMWMLVKSHHCVQLRVYKYLNLHCIHTYVRKHAGEIRNKE